jgi:ribosome-binding factor A
MTSFDRAERVSGLIQETLSELLKKRIHDPRLHMATITRVKMSADLKSARIYYAIYGGEKKSKDAARGFESARGFIKRILAPKLGLRYMPDLKFFYDDSFDYGSYMDQLFEKIKTDNGQNHQTH